MGDWIGKEINVNDLILRLCKAVASRCNLLRLKGKKRDDAVINFFCGAAQAFPEDSVEQKAIAAFLYFELQYQGYKAVEKALKEVPVAQAAV